MPNGGSDHCGNCRHNRVNIGRASTREERLMAAWCTIREQAIRSSTSTYCANHYREACAPIGPLFGTVDEHQRVPYHGVCYPRPGGGAACQVCGKPSGPTEGVEVADERLGTLEFCSARHYVRWWKQAHPGEPLLWDADKDA